MDFNELLKKFVEEDKINQLLEEMKGNKFFLASEENLDTRYSKLKEDHESLKGQHNEANKLIEQLKTSNAGNEDLQNKVSDYESKMAQLEAENNQLKIDNAIKVELLANKAKSEDLDYLMFKIKQNETEIKLDENGKLKGFDDVLTEIKTSCASQFEVEGKKKVDLNNLPNVNDSDNTITKEQFEKMGYSSRVKLREENPEMYNTLTKKN